VRLMWVSTEARRQGLATRLLDCCRCQFMPGYVLPRHELAFRWVGARRVQVLVRVWGLGRVACMPGFGMCCRIIRHSGRQA